MKRSYGVVFAISVAVLMTIVVQEAPAICAIYNPNDWEWYWFLCYLSA